MICVFCSSKFFGRVLVIDFVGVMCFFFIKLVLGGGVELTIVKSLVLSLVYTRFGGNLGTIR